MDGGTADGRTRHGAAARDVGVRALVSPAFADPAGDAGFDSARGADLDSRIVARARVALVRPRAGGGRRCARSGAGGSPRVADPDRVGLGQRAHLVLDRAHRSVHLSGCRVAGRTHAGIANSRAHRAPGLARAGRHPARLGGDLVRQSVGLARALAAVRVLHLLAARGRLQVHRGARADRLERQPPQSAARAAGRHRAAAVVALTNAGARLGRVADDRAVRSAGAAEPAIHRISGRGGGAVPGPRPGCLGALAAFAPSRGRGSKRWWSRCCASPPAGRNGRASACRSASRSTG